MDNSKLTESGERALALYFRLLEVAENYSWVIAIISGLLFALGLILGRLVLVGKALGWLGMVGMAIVEARTVIPWFAAPSLARCDHRPWNDFEMARWTFGVAVLAIVLATFYAVLFQNSWAAVALGLWVAGVCIFFGPEAVEWILLLSKDK